jgi:uncharacterized protein (DUF58 family)
VIPDHIMRELRFIEVATARKMRSLRAGSFTSRSRGDGFDFDELQPYRPGDDVRRIDWNVTARLDAPFVRHTHAERELKMVIAMDVSRSMELGTDARSKRETMMFITASLVFSALADQVNTGFVAFSDRVLLSSPPRRRRAAAWAILERCWAAADRGGSTAILPVVRHLLRSLKGMSIIFLVSDFLTDEDLFGGADLRMLAARHDVIAVVPQDRLEQALPAGPGYVQVRDLESGRRAGIDLGPASRARFAAEVRRRRASLARAFYNLPVDHVFLDTGGPLIEPLLAVMAARTRR